MFSLPQVKTNTIQNIARIALGCMLIFTGTGHLTFLRTEFLAQVPPWVPMNGDLVVVLSGIAELSLGLSIIFITKYKAQVGWVVALFFIAIFPGNISQYVNHVYGFGLDTDTKRFVRLFFQPVLIVWAIWCTGALKAWLHRKDLLKAV